MLQRSSLDADLIGPATARKVVAQRQTPATLQLFLPDIWRHGGRK